MILSFSANCNYSAAAEVSKNPAEHALQQTVAAPADCVFSQFGSFMFTKSHSQCCLSHTLNLFSFHHLQNL